MTNLFKTLGIEPKDITLYETALTHSSFGHENNTVDYERLEFLGDSVIQILISKYLFINTSKDQGDLTKTRSQSVREEALCLFADKINLSDFMRLGNSEKDKGPNQAMLADCYEALFGAIFLDLGFDAANDVFKRIVIPNLDLVKNIKDYKTRLQELVQVDRRTLSYKTIKIGGSSNNPRFKSDVLLDGIILMGSGIGTSKKIAEQNAALDALKKVAKDV